MQKMKKSQTVFAVICLGFLVLMLLSVCLRYGTRAILIERMGMDNWFTRLVMFDAEHLTATTEGGDNDTEVEVVTDWEALYPHTEDIQIHEAEDTERSETRVEAMMGLLNSAATEYTTTHLMFYDSFVSAALRCESLLQWNYVTYSEYNGIVELPDGWLYGYQEIKDMSEQAESTKSLADFCEDQGAEFLYIQAPQKITAEEDPDICGVLDFSVQNADNFLAALQENDIQTLDLRELLKEDGMTRQKIFYRTDHHWRSGTGLWAAGKILSYLQDNYGYDSNPERLVTDLFTEELYPAYFLGSQGKKVKVENTEPDDFVLYYPTYETSLHLKIPGLGLDETGDMTVCYDMEQVSEIGYYNKSPYHTYSYGDNALIRIENLLDDDGLRALLLHDSFSDCVIPFLSLGIEYLDAIDLRHFTGSLETFIEETRPNIVIALYNPSEYKTGIDWTKCKDLFDFR